MPSTIEQAKEAILKHGGKASKHQIARELKISLDYASLVLGELKRKEEIGFSDGFYSLVPIMKDGIQDEKQEKPVIAKKPVIKRVVRRSKKARDIKKKARKSRTDKKEISPLRGILGINESLVRTLEKVGYATIESLADAPINKLMDAAKLELRTAAQLINQARKAK